MEYTIPRAARRPTKRGRAAWLLAVLLGATVASSLPPVAEPAAAACCACFGTGCPAGFCVDGSVANCVTFCAAAGCPNSVFSASDVCDAGCGAAAPFPTLTPTPSPTGTVPTATASRTASVTLTATPTSTAVATPTQPICCQGTQQCVQVPMSGMCPSGNQPVPGYICDAAGRSCFFPTPTPSATRTVTSTATSSQTLTPTQTPTPSYTLTPSLTPTTTLTFTLTPTNTGTATATPPPTDTPPYTPTPAVCCESLNSCHPDKGQIFPGGTPICTPVLGNDGVTTVSLVPKLNSSCIGNVCVPFTPTGIFTATPTQTPTFTPTFTPTNTATPTETFAVPSNIDPYKCYRIKESGGKFKTKDVTLIDKFGGTRTGVLKPFLVCNPSIESSNDTNPAQTPGAYGAQINPGTFMVCFKIRERNDPQYGPRNDFDTRETRVIFHDEPATMPPSFTTLKFGFKKGQLLCMPSTMLPTPTPKRQICRGVGATPCPTSPPGTPPAYFCAPDDGTCKNVQAPTPTPPIPPL